LHVHSSFSLLEGALRIPQLAALASADRQPALALTDTGNLFGSLEFSEKMAGVGIQPIIGCSLAVAFADEPPSRTAAPQRFPRLVLLAANETGYRNLMSLVSRSFLEIGDTEASHAPFDWLANHAEGLIALTGGPDGPIDAAIVNGRAEVAKNRI